ncbi:MAG: hypothetical protein COT85_06205 [Chlamydiae bacterium CG10_big_fil_rev_8_21_14_0_10_42_34]|nr:MAG: hypothetical protein COT85_06205 [Chlamydiae bacterium CG10_big_fil_rev_8_21_14_0_10_42_34]
MNYFESQSFFEASSGPQMENSLGARTLCLKDFLKRLVAFPLDLVKKIYKTFFRGMGLGFAAVLLLVTLGCSMSVREFFVRRVIHFAKDVAEWVLLPFNLVGSFVRLLLALCIHPNFYFNSLV